MACIGSKSCCDTCCVGAACWDGFGVLADLGMGSAGNGLLRFGCAVFAFTPSMSRASSAIIVVAKFLDFVAEGRLCPSKLKPNNRTSKL